MWSCARNQVSQVLQIPSSLWAFGQIIPILWSSDLNCKPSQSAFSRDKGDQETQVEGFPKLRAWYPMSGELWRGRSGWRPYENATRGRVLSPGSVREER